MGLNPELSSWKSRGKQFKYNDYEIFYINEGKGEPLLILHGYPYSSFEWTYIWPHLTASYQVIIPDLLGMGFSDKPEKHRYSYEEHAEIINRLLVILKIKECHILSHDLGVSITQELIARNNESENHFSILSTAFLNGGLFTDAYKPRMIQRLLSQSPDLVGKIISRFLPRNKVEKTIKSLFGPQTQPGTQFFNIQWEVLNYKKGKTITYLIGRLIFDKKKYQERWITAMQVSAVPMCFINGPFDPNSGLQMVKRYQELIPDPLIYLLADNIGHWPQIEDPEGVFRSYQNFRDAVRGKDTHY